MEEKTCSFAEKIGGMTFIVNLKPTKEAKQNADEYFKALITKESLALEADCAQTDFYFQPVPMNFFEK